MSETFTRENAKSWIKAIESIVIGKLSPKKAEFNIPAGFGVLCEIRFSEEPTKDNLDAVIKQLQSMRQYLSDQGAPTNKDLLDALYKSVEQVFEGREP